MNMDNYLDLWDLLTNELIGDVWLLIFLGIIVIWFLSMRNKLTTEITIIFTVIFLSAIFAHIYFEIIWVFIVVGVGAFTYYKIQKVIRHG